MSRKSRGSGPLLPGFDGEDQEAEAALAQELQPAAQARAKLPTAEELEARSRVLAGIDEAGLGPMLGPLTMGYCAMRVARGAAPLWELLEEVVAGAPRDARGRLVVADSKVVFSRNAAGHQRLERTVLAFLAQRSCGAPRTGTDLLDCAPPSDRPDAELLSRHPWYAEMAASLPQWCTSERIAMDASSVQQAMRAKRVSLLDAGMRIVPAGELNASYDRTGNKGATVWQRTSSLIAFLWQRHSVEGLSLVVDRQGGRFHYLAPLKACFPAAHIEVLRETPPLSEYVLREERPDGQPSRRMLLRFAERAEERSFTVALASCFAKYARETCMDSFNRYFEGLQGELRPTAGYVTDARRWLLDAEAAVARADLAPRVLVRER